MTRIVRAWFGAAVVAVVLGSTLAAGASAAAPRVFAGPQGDGFAVIDAGRGACTLATVALDTGVATPFGPTDSEHCAFDLAMAPGGTDLYGVVVIANTAHLFRYDTATGVATDVGQIGNFGIAGPGAGLQGDITFDTTGQPVVWLVPDQSGPPGPCNDNSRFCLFRTDTANPGTATLRGGANATFTVFQGLASNCTTNAFSFRSAGPLVTVDTSTGSETTVGSLGPGFSGLSLDFSADGTLFGVGFSNAGPSVFVVDPSTGAATQVAVTTVNNQPTPLNALAIPQPSCPPPPAGSTVTVTANPGNAVEGGADGAFVFTRSGDTSASLTVGYSASGSADAGTDYTPLTNAFIPAGQTSVTIPVHALQDSPDNGEDVTVAIAPGSGYTPGTPNQATVTILETSPTSACDNVQPAPYNDRDQFDVHAHNIDCITAYGLAKGHEDGSYGAIEPVSRAQMASFVARLVALAGVTLPENPPDAFPADNAGPPHELAINQLAALGVLDGTTGEQGTTYGVSDAMRRDDMAQILFNAHKLITGSNLPAGEADTFTDVSNGGDPHSTGTDNADAINALAKAGVVQGTGFKIYNPTGSVSRRQFASFFARDLQLLVDAGKVTPLT